MKEFVRYSPALLLICLLLQPLSAAPPKKILLWPEGAPGAKGDQPTDQPTLTIYLPARESQNGAAVVVCPGGGYGHLAKDHEGSQIAEYFNAFGISAFVLHYRLGSKGYHHPIPLGDAQRALRMVRHGAKQYRIDPKRIGIMGFSAGGHLASTAGTKFDQGKADAKDPIDRVGCRPDFMILCYPVISFTTKFTHQGSKRNLLGKQSNDEKLVRHLSNELQVTRDTPPTFLFHTNEDRGVPPENSVLFYLALRKAGIPAELHIYQKGRHGVGLSPKDPILSTWSKRLKDWMATNRLLTRST